VQSAQSGQGDSSVDPKAELQAYKDQLKKNQTTLDQIAQQNAAIQQKITVLESGLSEVDQVVTSYAQGYETISDQSALRSFIEQQQRMALAAIGAGKTGLDAVVTGIDTDIKTQGASIQELQTANDKAITAQNDALKAASDAQAAYDAVKTTLNKAQEVVADLNSLKTLVNSAVDAGSFGTMYILLGEMTARLGEFNLPKPSDLQTQLSKALWGLQTALSDLRDKKQVATDASDALGAAQKRLDAAKEGRRASLLAAVKDWKPQAAAAAAKA